MQTGNNVRIVKCDVCPKVIGKTVKVVEVKDDNSVVVKYGKGRPQLNRPSIFSVEDVVAAE